ncbi:MAG TPA: hypothetical protein P5275_12740 [Saprospiraceae bacterium]|nr:hypothetical protein [Saprospiraceae bacterium]MCB9271872.1 hypothetical protein [Lewinellaceae bacterium]HPG09033.1 hypothetical protein [Saprospiraceae bacterium]HPR01044.1 hypothetical protein [Saprospiraceae bacterium]HQU53569.1 hypothetical protein [Saprospiraceae bacterium]
MSRKPLYVLFFMLLACSLQAQFNLFGSDDNANARRFLYTEEWAFQMRMNTNGFNIGYSKNQILRYYKTSFYRVELGYLRDPKEFRQNLRSQTILQSITSINGYIYGKQNSLLVLRGSLGGIHYFGEKARRKGVAVGYSYEIGPALGMLKPYYLEIKRIVEDGNSTRTFSERYSEANAEEFLDPNDIYGHSSFFKGISQMKFVPGVQGKIGAHFSWGPEDQYVRFIETGLMFDLFTQRMPIMVQDTYKPYFLNLYVSLQFGKRK